MSELTIAGKSIAVAVTILVGMLAATIICWMWGMEYRFSLTVAILAAAFIVAVAIYIVMVED